MTPHNKRELIYLGIIILITIGFFAAILTIQPTINSYKKAYSECMNAYTMAENGRLPLWEYNITLTTEAKLPK